MLEVVTILSIELGLSKGIALESYIIVYLLFNPVIVTSLIK